MLSSDGKIICRWINTTVAINSRLVLASYSVLREDFLAIASANQVLTNDEKISCCWGNPSVAVNSHLDLINNWVLREDFPAPASAKQVLSNDEKNCAISSTQLLQ